MTQRVSWLAGHMRRHPKDYHSRRGLEMVLARRRKLLTYLRGNNFDAYALLLTRLNLKDNYAKEVRDPLPEVTRRERQRSRGSCHMLLLHFLLRRRIGGRPHRKLQKSCCTGHVFDGITGNNGTLSLDTSRGLQDRLTLRMKLKSKK